jgi:hypothetical protein
MEVGRLVLRPRSVVPEPIAVFIGMVQAMNELQRILIRPILRRDRRAAALLKRLCPKPVRRICSTRDAGEAAELLGELVAAVDSAGTLPESWRPELIAWLQDVSRHAGRRVEFRHVSYRERLNCSARPVQRSFVWR